MEDLQIKHRKEQRDLLAKITQKKKSATKKTRKGVNDECDVLQRDLQERQSAELTLVSQDSVVDGMQDLHVDDGQAMDHGTVAIEDRKEVELAAGIERVKVHAASEDTASVSTASRDYEGHSKKPNRQKARLARRAAEQEAQVAQAAEEATNIPDLREQELEAMKKHIKDRGLTEISIRPDGHCLYSAIATQLQDGQLRSSKFKASLSTKPYQLVRITAGDFISDHPDDFAAFLEEPLDIYVSKIRDTAEWGGQLELQAAARAYGMDINVLQGDGRVEKIESGSSLGQDAIWLAYYRHSFGLGEHYNALTKIS